MPKTLVAVLGTAALAFAAGCGSDEKESTPPASSSSRDTPTTADAEPLTKAEFISQADDICRDVKAASERFEDDFKKKAVGGAGVEDVAEILTSLLDETRKGVAALRALPAPAEDKATLDEYLASRDRSLELGSKLEAAAKEGDDGEVAKLLQNTDAFDSEQRELARKYGFEYCGTTSGLIN